MLVALPEDFAPVEGVGVDGASVVEYYALYRGGGCFDVFCDVL